MATTTTLDKMSPEVLFCRTEKHLTPTYHDHDLVFSRNILISYERTITCKRCTYERTQVLVYGPTGYEVDHSKTRYPPGYLNAHGRLRLAEVRVEQMARAGHRVKGQSRKAAAATKTKVTVTAKVKPKSRAKAKSAA